MLCAKKKKIMLRTVAVTLVCAMLFTMLPTDCFRFSAKAEEETEPVYVVKELEEYRTETAKTYLKSDGSMTQIVSADPLHYEQDGVWQEIDNTLRPVERDGETCLENTGAAFKATLPETMEQDSAVTVEKDGYSVSVSPVSVVKSASGKVKNNEKKASEKQKKTMTAAELAGETALCGSVEYADVFENTDVVYDVVPSGVKESLVLDKKPNKHLQYSYTVTAGGLRADLLEDQSIEFYTGEGDAREVVFTMPAPYMFDRENAQSHAITVELRETGDGVYTLTYTPSSDWLRAKERAYPVTIDPTVVKVDISGGYVISGTPDTGYCYEQKLRVGYYRWPGDTPSDFISYLRFANLWRENTSDVITSATLHLTSHRTGGYSNEPVYVGVFDVQEGWNDTLTYNDQPATAANPMDYADLNSVQLEFDVTAAVNSWCNGLRPNYGFMFKMLKEYGSPEVLYDIPRVPSGADRPYLEININCTPGGNSTNRGIDVGSAGTVYINDHTGEVSLFRNDIGIDGNVMPVSIAMIYQARRRNRNDIKRGFTDMIDAYGRGFRANYNQTVRHYTTDAGEPYYAYTAEDGSVYYFERTSVEENGQTTVAYRDVSSGGRTIAVDLQNPEDYTSVTITDELDQRYYFDTYGRLIKIVSGAQIADAVTQSSVPAEGMTYEPGVIRITYRDFAVGTLAIDTVTDGAGRVYRFVYDDTTRMLNRIQYLGNGTNPIREVIYAYLDSGTLQSVTYSPTKTVYYGWTSDHLLYRAKNSDNYMFQFGYVGVRVNRIQEFGTDGTAGEDIMVQYGYNETRYYKTEDYTSGKTEVPYQAMQFNNSGDLLSYLVAGTDDDDIYSVYAQYSETDSASKATNRLLNLSAPQKPATNLLKDPIFENGFEEYENIYDFFTLDETNALFGQNCIKANVMATIEQDVWFTAGRTYTVSAYVKCENTSNNGTITVRAWKHGYQGQQEATFEVINQNAEASASEIRQSGWKRIYSTFRVTQSGWGYVSINLTRAPDATVYFDGFQLEYGDTISAFNMVSDELSQWSFSAGTGNGVSAGTGRDGSDTIGLGGAINTENTAVYTVPVSGKKGEGFTFGCWAKSPIFGKAENREFAARVAFLDAQGAALSDEETEPEQRIDFNSAVDGWQYVSAGVTAPADFASVRITLVNRDRMVPAQFDSVRLSRGVYGYNYYYKDNGALNYIEEITLPPRSIRWAIPHSISIMIKPAIWNQ